MNSQSNKKKKEYRCPRCGKKDIIDYGSTFDCKYCRLEFEKRDFELYAKENILSIEEKLKFIKQLKD